MITSRLPALVRQALEVVRPDGSQAGFPFTREQRRARPRSWGCAASGNSGRGGAGKSVLGRQLGKLTGLSVIELDSLFWQRGLTAADPAEWAERQRELVRREAWILDGDLGPNDRALDVRLRAADTIIVLDFTVQRCRGEQ